MIEYININILCDVFFTRIHTKFNNVCQRPIHPLKKLNKRDCLIPKVAYLTFFCICTCNIRREKDKKKTIQ